MQATALLQKHFGYPAFRKGQSDIINAILAQQDTLGVMPTGAGKSICYQIPALMLSGITLVISPLISLMHDQVDTLQQLGIPSAFLNSSLSPADQQATLYAAEAGHYKLLYVAPERLLTPSFLAFAQRTQIAMLTVDEAHCVSQWGQNFRPNYLDIAPFLSQLPYRPIVSAFTATATGRVKEDICALLKLQNPAVFSTGFDRENLYFSVETPRKKSAALFDFLRTRGEESGIVYCSTRKTVERVCDELRDKGFSAARYHAGLPTEERTRAQNDFLFDRTRIMVATNAFGMGIDKSNVSFVVHYNMPKDVESYYQEAGRAGRDGSPAHCVLFYSGQDVVTNQRFIRLSEEATPEQIERELARLSQMTFYCTTTACLREYMLKYFGEKPPASCSHCGNCDTNFDTVDITIDAQKIISCVVRAQQRYGATMITDILRGVDNERIRNFGLDQLSTYGICDAPATTLRQIIDFLLYRGYLRQSDGEYPVLQRTAKATALLRGEETLTMAMRKEQQPTRADAAAQAQLPAALAPLYALLQQERARLAAEQGVPAFVIFSDKTLRELCTLLPQTSNALLRVSGIGEMKRARYGAAFLDIITAYCAEHADVVGVAAGADVEIGTGAMARDGSGLRGGSGKSDILPDAALLARVTTSDKPLSVRDIAQALNDVLEPAGCAKISAPKITNWLIAEGYLEVVETENGAAKAPTAQGRCTGITQEARHHKATNRTYQVNLYPAELQRVIITHAADILRAARG